VLVDRVDDEIRDRREDRADASTYDTAPEDHKCDGAVGEGHPEEHERSGRCGTVVEVTERPTRREPSAIAHAAVLEVVLMPLADVRDHALATGNTGDALAAFVHEAVRLGAEREGLTDALGRQPFGSDVRERLRVLAIEITEPVVERAHRNGELRDDFDADDLLIALRMHLAALAVIGTKDPDRYVDVVLRGLRP
jgi:hypothetical protein